QPGPDVIASSPPLWSPTDRRLIFTTAREAKAGASRPVASAGNPEGDLFVERPVVYTCWLRDEPRNGQPAEPKAIFEAACDHPGYVAAGLAVRWHPTREKVLYVQQTGEQQHGLFEYDLATQKSRQVFPSTGKALVFDWTPDGNRLVCVLGCSDTAAKEAGIW